jgi:putative nucleotidyltransferase with HDIG domain
MPGKIADPTVAHQVELVIHRLNSLSTLPCVATRFLSHLSQARLSDLAETIESDPALTAAILSLAHRLARHSFGEGGQGLSCPDESFSVRRAIDKLPAHAVRQALLSVKIYPAFGRDERRVLFRKQLVEHCLAVACCAEDIAAILSPQMDSQLAYSAGLLHDIGKLALDETMPRSFAGIVEQAKSQQTCSRTLEQKHLGLDHTILGKRLAAKWRLPNQIVLAIWLHHSDVNLLSQNMPEAKIAQVVQLADLIARQCGIGQSGSFDLPKGEVSPQADKIAQSLAINPDQLEQIRRSLPDKVAQKSEVLGLDSPVTADDYCNAVHAAAAQLAQKQSELALENRHLQTALSHFDFTKEFLLSIDSNDEPIDIAENFAVRWQKFYQTGLVCLYLVAPGNSQSSVSAVEPFLKAVVVESPSQTKVVLLNAPADAALRSSDSLRSTGTPAIPQAIANSFAILNAQEHIGWLFEQLDVEFDLSHTKLLPLLTTDYAIGAIVFELHCPVETEQFEEKFKTIASIAGAVLDMAFASAGQQRFAEQFAQSLATPMAKPVADLSDVALAKSDALDALAEMAAGAAHELNNPLSVISGRAQMLAAGETDPQKKQILGQIQKNAGEISAIIDDLFVFASPPQPRPTWTAHRQILDEAIQLASQKTGVEHIDARIEVIGDIKNIFADSAQVASAIANVICNSIESYADSFGPVKITASADHSSGFVKLTIADFGCGMDEQTLQKATYPFFSNLPAGRKRGMGLAHAARLIQLNGGNLSITSTPGTGTTVTILLPCK